MNIEMKEMEDYDFLQVESLIEELYAELGEPTGDIPRLRDGFMFDLVTNNSSMVLLFKSFITGELLSIATLTESNAVAGRKYGVLDQIFTPRKFRSSDLQEALRIEVKVIARKNGYDRVDVAAPTDAWYRTVRFQPTQELRLTMPKFKHIVKCE